MENTALLDQKSNGSVPMPGEHITTNPLDMSPEVFQAGLDRRKTNRDSLMAWVKDSLVEDVDFGKIHIVKKDMCPKGKFCDNPRHFAKPSLFKPGAEKICGMLGMTPTFPNLPEYETMVLNGGVIEQIILRCEMVSGNGQVIAEGAGARSVKQDKGDLNKALKMCLKSAQIDATLRCAGLSEVFTQDIETMNFDDDEPVEFNRDAKVGFGKHKDLSWHEVDIKYLEWLILNFDNEKYKSLARQELDARHGTDKPINGKPVTVKQLDRLMELADAKWGKDKAEGELHLLVQKKYGVESVNGLTVDQANAVGISLSVTVEGLIRCVSEKFDFEAPRSVEYLNSKAKEMFDLNTIDSLTPHQLNSMMSESQNWDVPF